MKKFIIGMTILSSLAGFSQDLTDALGAGPDNNKHLCTILKKTVKTQLRTYIDTHTWAFSEVADIMTEGIDTNYTKEEIQKINSYKKAIAEMEESKDEASKLILDKEKATAELRLSNYLRELATKNVKKMTDVNDDLEILSHYKHPKSSLQIYVMKSVLDEDYGALRTKGRKVEFDETWKKYDAPDFFMNKIHTIYGDVVLDSAFRNPEILNITEHGFYGRLIDIGDLIPFEMDPEKGISVKELREKYNAQDFIDFYDNDDNIKSIKLELRVARNITTGKDQVQARLYMNQETGNSGSVRRFPENFVDLDTFVEKAILLDQCAEKKPTTDENIDHSEGGKKETRRERRRRERKERRAQKQ